VSRRATSGRPTPRVVLLRVLVVAAIGAAATVLVAWGCPYFNPDIGPKTIAVAGTRTVDSVEYPRFDFDPGPGAELRHQRPGLRLSWIHRAGEPAQVFIVLRIGLPMHALIMRHEVLGPNGDAIILGGFATPSFLKPHRPEFAKNTANRSPYLPLWPGFLVDTVFWGGAAFVVWSVPGLVRRGVRRRRGRCVRCGYELKGLTVCPECGGGA
jgi:hypothetical protein